MLCVVLYGSPQLALSVCLSVYPSVYHSSEPAKSVRSSAARATWWYLPNCSKQAGFDQVFTLRPINPEYIVLKGADCLVGQCVIRINILK